MQILILQAKIATSHNCSDQAPAPSEPAEGSSSLQTQFPLQVDFLPRSIRPLPAARRSFSTPAVRRGYFCLPHCHKALPKLPFKSLRVHSFHHPQPQKHSFLHLLLPAQTLYFLPALQRFFHINAQIPAISKPDIFHQRSGPNANSFSSSRSYDDIHTPPWHSWKSHICDTPDPPKSSWSPGT